jgi:hypothetical protein
MAFLVAAVCNGRGADRAKGATWAQVKGDFFFTGFAR